VSNSFLDNVPEDLSTEEAASNLNTEVTTFDRIRQGLAERANQDRDVMVPEPLQEVLMNEEHAEEIGFIFQITNKYMNGDIDQFSHEIDHDLAKLAAGLVRLSTILGYAEGVAGQVEAARKFAIAKTFTQVKDIAEEEKLHVTDSSTNNLSREASKEIIKYKNETHTISRVLSNLYYSARVFIQILEGVSKRLHIERLGPIKDM